MFDNDNMEKPAIKPGKIIIPKIQLFMLFIILLGYPLLTLVMNYLSPPDDVVIESRIIQIYLPGLVFQAFVFISIMIAVLYAPLKQDGAYWSSKENLASIGIKRADFTLRNIAIGIIFLFSAVIVLNMLSNIIGNYDIFQAEDITYLLPRKASERVFWIILSISAGIAEELAFRGFVLTRMELITGSMWPGVIIGSFCFGIGHLYQGWAGVVLISVYGVMFSLLFFARGSLVPCIVAHILQDVLAAFAM